MDAVFEFLQDMPFWGWITIIVLGATAIEGVVKVKRMQIKHAERIAKIQQGIDPGSEVEAYKKDEV
ncbi:MAG: hypothetical protein ACYS0H_29745 [Planctomycetota bacterium]|jgi:hypothetical protein